MRNGWGHGIDHQDRPFRGALGREANEFRGYDFSGMTLLEAAFRFGIDLAEQRLPSGDAYCYLPDAAGAIAAVRAEVTGWDDADRRSAALNLLDLFASETKEGQRQVLLSPTIDHKTTGFGSPQRSSTCYVPGPPVSNRHSSA